MSGFPGGTLTLRKTPVTKLYQNESLRSPPKNMLPLYILGFLRAPIPGVPLTPLPFKPIVVVCGLKDSRANLPRVCLCRNLHDAVQITLSIGFSLFFRVNYYDGSIVAF